MIQGREHVTYFISSMAPGEERDLSINYRLHTCRKAESTITPKWYYEVTGGDQRPSTNGFRNPEEVITMHEIQGL
ncbi:hypothetical protein NHH15_00085 [Lachnospiraceae bacterium PAL113]|uniref:Uncharacterized protein n=1 Tax=Aequitasia blattaphilus TaxID=2949332 RepID=A0ABT1E4Q2_9FIRM|nr:hypothetical protein [Aequitasia blattaphilus]MCR8613453.1 hypothetical protein [Aequitasia blattaphilus]